MIPLFNSRLIVACGLALLLALTGVPTAQAVPPLPFGPHGAVRVNDAPVASGVVIGAWCAGVRVATTATEMYEGQALYSLDVPGDDPDTPVVEFCAPLAQVTFTIGGIQAEQTAPWVSGDSPVLDLTATIARKDATVTLEIHASDETVVTSVPSGAFVHGKAAVAGSDGTPTGAVVFTFYNNAECATPGAAAGSVTLVAGAAHPSDLKGPLAAGHYAFQAHYNGDNFYNPADSACQPLTVAGHVFLPLILRG